MMYICNTYYLVAQNYDIVAVYRLKDKLTLQFQHYIILKKKTFWKCSNQVKFAVGLEG